MTAKEMFEELGYKYKHFKTDKRFTYIKKTIKETKWEKWGSVEVIDFDYKNKNIMSQQYNLNENFNEASIIEYCHKNIRGSKFIDLEELKAIKQQCKELGWLDE